MITHSLVSRSTFDAMLACKVLKRHSITNFAVGINALQEYHIELLLALSIFELLQSMKKVLAFKRFYFSKITTEKIVEKEFTSLVTLASYLHAISILH